MAFEPGRSKTGGRKKGTPNIARALFAEVLESKGFSIPEKALELYQQAKDRNELNLQLDVLKMMAPYVHTKFKNVELINEEGPRQSEIPLEEQVRMMHLLECMNEECMRGQKARLGLS